MDEPKGQEFASNCNLGSINRAVPNTSGADGSRQTGYPRTEPKPAAKKAQPSLKESWPVQVRPKARRFPIAWDLGLQDGHVSELLASAVEGVVDRGSPRRTCSNLQGLRARSLGSGSSCCRFCYCCSKSYAYCHSGLCSVFS